MRLAANDLGFELGDLFPDDVALASKRREPAFELMQLPLPYTRKVGSSERPLNSSGITMARIGA